MPPGFRELVSDPEFAKLGEQDRLDVFNRWEADVLKDAQGRGIDTSSAEFKDFLTGSRSEVMARNEVDFPKSSFSEAFQGALLNFAAGAEFSDAKFNESIAEDSRKAIATVPLKVRPGETVARFIPNLGGTATGNFDEAVIEIPEGGSARPLTNFLYALPEGSKGGISVDDFLAREKQSLHESAGRSAENVKQARELRDSASAYSPGIGAQKFYDAKTMGESLSAFLDDPVDVMKSVVGNATASAVNPILTGRAGGAAGGPGGAAFGAFVGGFKTEYSTAFRDHLEKKAAALGYDITTDSGVLAALRDQRIVGESQKEAFDRATTTGAFDAMTMGIGAALGKKFATRALVETVGGAAGGAAGERIAQIRANEPYQPSEVISEALGGMVLGGADVTIDAAKAGVKSAFSSNESQGSTQDSGGDQQQQDQPPVDPAPDDPLVEPSNPEDQMVRDVQTLRQLRNEALTFDEKDNLTTDELQWRLEIQNQINELESKPGVREVNFQNLVRGAAESSENARQQKSSRVLEIDQLLDQQNLDPKTEDQLLSERLRLTRDLDQKRESPTLREAAKREFEIIDDERQQLVAEARAVEDQTHPEISDLAARKREVDREAAKIEAMSPRKRRGEPNQRLGELRKESAALGQDIQTAQETLRESVRKRIGENREKLEILAGNDPVAERPITTKKGTQQKGFKRIEEAQGFRNRQPFADDRGLVVREREDGRFVVVEPTFSDVGQVRSAQKAVENASESNQAATSKPDAVAESQDAALEEIAEEQSDPLESADYEQRRTIESHAGFPDQKLIDRIVARQTPPELAETRSKLRAKHGFRAFFSSLIYDDHPRVPDWFRAISDRFKDQKKGAKLMAQNAVASMQGQIKQFTKGMSAARAKAVKDSALAVLRGQNPTVALSTELMDSLAIVRNLIDEFSQMAIRSGALHPAVEKAYAANVGEYLIRAYKVQDPAYNWSINTIKRDNPALYQRGVQHFMSKGMTQQEAEATVASIADPAKAAGFIEMGRSFNALPPSYFRGKKDIHPIVRELMGEITDPFDVAARSLDKVTTIAYEAEMQRALIERGVQLGVLTPDRTPVNSERLNFQEMLQEAVGEVYSDPATAEALVSAMARTRADSDAKNMVLRSLAALTSISKFLTVIASPYGVQTNTLGAVATEMWNGRSPMRFGKGMVTHFLGKVRRLSRSPKIRAETMAQREAYRNRSARGWRASDINTSQLEVELEHQGIFNQGVFAQDFLHGLDKAMDRGSVLRRGLGELGTVGKAADGSIRAMADVYQSPDNAVKANAFLAEAETYAKANPHMTIGEIFDLAGQDVLHDTQNYSKVPAMLRAVSTYGGLTAPVSPYVSFGSELIRSWFSNYQIAARQLRSGNPVLMRRGARRVAATVAMAAGAAAVKAALQRKSGTDEDERDFLKHFYLPDFHNKKSVTFVEAPDGRIRYLDDTYALPQIVFSAPLADSARAVLDGDEDTDAASAFLMSFNENVIGQFGGDSQVADALKGLLSNQDQHGNKIFNEDLRGQPGSGIAEAQARMRYAMEAGYLPTIERVRRRMAEGETIGYFGNVHNKGLEMQKLLGIRPYEIDLKTATPTVQKRFYSRWRALKQMDEKDLQQSGVSAESRDVAMDSLAENYRKFREGALRFEIADEKALRETEKHFSREFRGW